MKSYLKHRIRLVLRSIKLNSVFWIILGLSLFSIHKASKTTTFIEVLFSMMYAMFCGYWVHVISHTYSFEKEFLDENSPYILKTIAQLIDFHDQTHHDSSKNRSTLNVIIEIIENFVMQTLSIFISSITIFGKTIMISKPVIILWGLLYTTIHHINYNTLETSEMHIQHHINSNTNYFPDFLDILFDTKYDMEDIENINSCSINIILLTILILNFYSYRERK